MRPIKEIIVHCAATRAGTDDDCGAKTIDNWHRARGWAGIGYHYVIRRDGTIETGRPLEKIGAHAEGRNTGSIGICLIGGLDPNGKTLEGIDKAFTPQQAVSLSKLLRELCHRFGVESIIGHRDTGTNKACPCFDVRSWWTKEKLDA